MRLEEVIDAQDTDDIIGTFGIRLNSQVQH